VEFEQALANAEDDQDVIAAKTTQAEAAAELTEFDENIPIDDEGGNGGVGGLSKEPELSKAEKEVQIIIKLLLKSIHTFSFSPKRSIGRSSSRKSWKNPYMYVVVNYISNYFQSDKTSHTHP
jgi:hypothetical protein